MAWTTTKLSQYGIGNIVVQHWALSADSATLELSTGLANVLFLNQGAKSAATLAFKCKPNILSAGTAAYGNVAITAAASGDDIYLTVVGN